MKIALFVNFIHLFCNSFTFFPGIEAIDVIVHIVVIHDMEGEHAVPKAATVILDIQMGCVASSRRKERCTSWSCSRILIWRNISSDGIYLPTAKRFLPNLIKIVSRFVVGQFRNYSGTVFPGLFGFVTLKIGRYQTLYVENFFNTDGDSRIRGIRIVDWIVILYDSGNITSFFFHNQLISYLPSAYILKRLHIFLYQIFLKKYGLQKSQSWEEKLMIFEKISWDNIEQLERLDFT